MTQEEQEKLTQQAMENAKKARPDVKQKEVTTVPTPPTVPTPVKLTEPKTKPQTKKLLDNQRKLGDRIVTLSPWAGKTKKKFKKEFQYAESMADVDLQKIVEILVYDQIEEDYQLTELELQYLLAELKEMSIGDKVECESNCPSCGVTNSIEASTKDLVFKPDTLPAEYKNFKFKNIKRSTFTNIKNNIMNSKTFDGLSSEADIEIACKISIDNKSPNEMLTIFDDTPLNELSLLMDKYVEHLAFFELTKDKVCSGCRTKVSFDVDMVTGIFEILAK